MLLKIGQWEFTVSLKGQPPSSELIVTDGTLLMKFSDNLSEVADTPRNEMVRSRIQKCLKGFFPVEEVVNEHGRRHERRFLTLDTKFESLATPFKMIHSDQFWNPATMLSPLVHKIYVKKPEQELAHPIARNTRIATASAHKKPGRTLVAVSTSSDLLNTTCVAILETEHADALKLMGEFEAKYKHWSIYETQNVSILMYELFRQYSQSFDGFYSRSSIPIPVKSSFEYAQPNPSTELADDDFSEAMNRLFA